MPTLTLRIDEKSPEHDNLEKVKEIFEEKSCSKAILKSLKYASEYNYHTEILRNTVEERDRANNEISQLRDLLRKKSEIEERLNNYLLINKHNEHERI